MPREIASSRASTGSSVSLSFANSAPNSEAATLGFSSYVLLDDLGCEGRIYRERRRSPNEDRPRLSVVALVRLEQYPAARLR